MESLIQILHREIIKPSSPTPGHLRKMKLSYLDELCPSVFNSIIFFYEANESSNSLACSNPSGISQRLKQSLSNVLTAFYPFAGTLEDHSHIDCNDSGVEFVEARSQTYLEDVIQEHDAQSLNWYAPSDCRKQTLLSLKVTTFLCGGISIGISFSHKLADCASIMTFVNAWAATCRGETDFVRFTFNLADHFPPRGLPDLDWISNDENLVIKRYLFNEEAITVLKREATSRFVKDPTKVEAVSSFICKHFIEVAKCKSSSAEMILPIAILVNLRTRMKDPPPHSLENVFANSIMVSKTLYNTDSVVISNLYQDLVRKLRSLIRKIDKDYIMKAKIGDEYLGDLQDYPTVAVKGELIEPCSFTSWCRFPVYEVDYGWGKPNWVCTTTLPVKNCTVMLDTKCGKGIEAWICMEKDGVEILYNKIKLISANASER